MLRRRGGVPGPRPRRRPPRGPAPPPLAGPPRPRPRPRPHGPRGPAWRAAVADELGTDTFDLAALQAAAGVDCQRTDAGAWTVQLALSGDTATSAVTRIGLEHACPDVVPAFEAGVAAVEAAADPLDLVCGPGVDLPAEAEMQADLVCAQR